jgi:hypothetical protein
MKWDISSVGNHTFSMNNEGTGANMEPGSGSTIMGYAGITSQDIQPHSDAFFHAISIQQITNNIKAKTCSVNTNTGNSIPTANAGLDYTIPKGTPFVLTGTGTDADGDSFNLHLGTNGQRFFFSDRSKFRRKCYKSLRT